MKWTACPLLAIAFAVTCAEGATPITIDGHLDEPEWAGARLFTDFRVIEPLTRETPEYPTELRVLARPEGLFFGVRSAVPREHRTHGRSVRDAPNMDADPIIVIVDFEGRGRTAYEFVVSLSGSERDSVILNQTQKSSDWDAIWYSAVSEDDAGWTVEMQIPWSVAPEGLVHGDQRTIGFWVSRYFKDSGRRYSLPAIEVQGPSFVQDFQKLEVPRFETSELHVIPYVSASTDFLNSTSRGRAGADVTWKPNGNQKLTATLNPDFGQVESDDLVVNFSAVETFFSDKRPFFTEGQQLFDLRLPFEGRLVNTRRIGAVNEVLGGAKFTGSHGDQEYGVFAAVEKDTDAARGSDFFAARWHGATPFGSIGYLGTLAHEPALDRNASVHTVDFDTTLRPGTTLNAMAMGSFSGAKQGFGSAGTFQYQPGGAWQETARWLWYDRNFDIDDLGYLERSSVRELQSETLLWRRSYPQASPFATSNWYLGVDVATNDYGRRLPANAEFGYDWQLRTGGNLYVNYMGSSNGLDDLILRGNGVVHVPAQQGLRAEFDSADSGTLRYILWGKLFQQGLSGWSGRIHLEPRYFFTEFLSMGLAFNYERSNDWLIWTHDNQLASYRSDLIVTALNGAWFPGNRHEIRLKAQWAAVRADFRQGYVVTGEEPVAAVTDATDFSVSHVALQIRYRYEFAPLSDLYVVYSRGGDISDDTNTRGFGRQLGDAWNQRTADQMLVKLQYRF